jgi:hypothetical protein
MRWAGHVIGRGEIRDVCKILVGEPEGNRALRRSRLGCKNNTKTDLKDVRWEGMDWINPAQVQTGSRIMRMW